MDDQRRVTPHYADSVFRVEYRPTYGLHSRDELRRILDALRQAGVDAWWYSAAAKGSYPLFRSRHLPARSDAVDPSFFRWLADEAHARGISLISWEYLTTAPLLSEQHPEWRWKLFDWDGPHTVRDKQYCCWNSPYGDMLEKYCLEVVGDCGFDGLWFDGSFLHGHGMTGRYACCCDFCARKYNRETGRDLPATVDLREQTCREYFVWRARDHMNFWRRLSEAVHRVKPDAVVAFNYFNRLGTGLDSGTPLDHLPGDRTSMLATEVGFHYHQTGVLSKALYAVNDNFRPEMWVYLADSPDAISAEPDPAHLVYHAQRCATYGADASFGVGREDLRDYAEALKALGEATHALAPFRGGRPIAEVAVVLSNRTKDFGHVTADGKGYDDTVVWNQVLGMHAILDSLRIQSSLLLDNRLTDEGLAGYCVVVMPGVDCVSDDAAAALRRFVERGGTLLTVGACGGRDEWGRPRPTNVLDALRGIRWHGEASAKLESDRGEVYPGDGVPFAADAEGVIPCTFQAGGGRRLGPEGWVSPDPAGLASALLFSRRSVGEGFAMHLAPDVAYAYAHAGPHARSRALIGRVLADAVTPLDTDAPPQIVINRYRRGEQCVVHLLDVPDTLNHLHLEHPDRTFPDIQTPSVFATHERFRLCLEGRWALSAASRPDARLHITVMNDTTQIVVEGFSRHLAFSIIPDATDSAARSASDR